MPDACTGESAFYHITVAAPSKPLLPLFESPCACIAGFPTYVSSRPGATFSSPSFSFHLSSLHPSLLITHSLSSLFFFFEQQNNQGTTITLSTKTSIRYEGVVLSTNGEGDTTGVTLKDVKDISNPGAPLKDQIFIASTNIEGWQSGPADAKAPVGNGDCMFSFFPSSSFFLRLMCRLLMLSTPWTCARTHTHSLQNRHRHLH